MSLDPAVRLYVLHPKTSEDAHESLNNTSVVVKLVYGDRSVLLVGDAEIDAERKFCPRYGKFLTADILKVGHHGSTTSSGSELLTLARPVLSLVSVGMKNKFGHPSERTLDRLSKFGSKILRTDEEGAIVLESDGKRWWRRDWRNSRELETNTDESTRS